MADPRAQFADLATVIHDYLALCLTRPSTSIRHANIRINIPKNVQWNDYIIGALTSVYGTRKSSPLSYSPSRGIFKVNVRPPYRRDILDYRFFSDIGCVATLMERTIVTEDSLPKDMLTGTSLVWVVPDTDMVVVIFVPDTPVTMRADFASLHGWDMKADADANMTDPNFRVFLTFKRSSPAVTTVKVIRQITTTVWCLVYNTANIYSHHAAAEMMFFLPTKKRQSRMLNYTDVSAKNNYLEGFICRPALPKRIDKCYLVTLESGLWMYHIRSKSVRLLNRDVTGISSMLRMPLLFYFTNSYGCIDPVVPYSSDESKWLEETFGSKRIVYDIGRLEAFLRMIRTFLSDVVDNVRVGSIWMFGDLDGVESRFANSSDTLGGYTDRIPYGRYVRGNSTLTASLGISGLSLIDPSDPSIEFVADVNFEAAKLLFTSEGLLCRMDILSQRSDADYVRDVSEADQEVVIYKGTRIFPFTKLAARGKILPNVIYEASIKIDSTLSVLSFRNLKEITLQSRLDPTIVANRFTDTCNTWKRVTHPVWTVLSGASSINRTNAAVWASLSRCFDLTEENSKVLIVGHGINMFYHTLELVSSTWKLSELRLSNDIPDRDVEGVERISFDEMLSLKGRSFDYVILALCNLELQSKVNRGLMELLVDLAPSARKMIQFTFDRGMIVESPLNFRYIFGDTKLKTFATPQPDVNVWIYSTEYFECMECPLDMDEASIFMHQLNFTPDPGLHPCHLSRFVPKMPSGNMSMLPEKLQVCTCFCRYSGTSPVMNRLHTQRDMNVSKKLTEYSNEIAAINDSDYYLVNTPTCTESIIHAMFRASMKAYNDLGDDMEAKCLHVRDYREWVKELMYENSQCVLQVCKGVHIVTPRSYQVCILNMIQGGNVTATMLRGSLRDRSSLPPYSSKLKCIVILRVSDENAYPVAQKISNGYILTHNSSKIDDMGRNVSEMLKNMVSIGPSGC